MKYRLAANKEVSYLIEQKNNDPRWDLYNYTISMDPRSRYFDPTPVDCPPMPYDDPAAQLYMHCVAGKKGWPCWHSNGNWYGLENPEWRALLTKYNEVTEDGAVKLTVNGAVCLAQVHNSGYRSQIETIYKVALDVSTERFTFDTQFFGNSETVFNADGGFPGNDTTTLTQDTSFQIRKHFLTGADLLVGFANSFVWQFAGPDTNFTTSLINFNFVQPLLRFGGREFELERLTRVERALLYALRAFQRYRQGFYTQVTVGAGGVPGVQRVGGSFGGTGLTGFTGTGAGGIGTVAAGQFGGGIAGGAAGGANLTAGTAGLAGGGAGNVSGGVLALLQQMQQLRNAEENLDALLRTVGLLEANLDAGLIDIVQVDNFRQNIETQRATVLAVQMNFQNQLEQFKLANLDWPPDVPLVLDDTLLEQFQFLDPETTAVQHLFEDYVEQLGAVAEAPDLPGLNKAVEVLGMLRDRAATQLESAYRDMDRLDEKAPLRKEQMDEEQAADFDEEIANLAESLADVDRRFGDTAVTLETIGQAIPTQQPGRTIDQIVSMATGLAGITQEIALIKARARLEAVTVAFLELDAPRALDIARANRLDWMNARASLVDQWRLIAVNANQLQSDLNLSFSGGLGTIGDNPLAFNGQNGNLRVGLQYNPPWARRRERNAYMTVLLDYQAQRRSLYTFQDGINLTLRSLLRTLRQLELNLEIQRRAVVIAVRRVDKTREDLNEPPPPVQPGQAVETLGPTVAQNLFQALTDLANSQNNFMSVVLQYYAQRMVLYRELGIMELDDCGMWIDRPFNEADWLTADQCPLPPEVPAEWLDQAGIDDATMERIEADRAREAAEGGLEEVPGVDMYLPPNIPGGARLAPELPGPGAPAATQTVPEPGLLEASAARLRHSLATVAAIPSGGRRAESKPSAVDRVMYEVAEPRAGQAPAGPAPQLRR